MFWDADEYSNRVVAHQLINIMLGDEQVGVRVGLPLTICKATRYLWVAFSHHCGSTSWYIIHVFAKRVSSKVQSPSLMT